MSQFKCLDSVREALCKTTVLFSWEQYVRQLADVRAHPMLEVVERRLSYVKAAVTLTGSTPTLAELMKATRSQAFSRPVHHLLLQVTATHIAQILLQCAWPHSTIMDVIRAAHDYQLFLCEPLAGQEDHSNGVIAELTNFAEGWLATL